MQTDDSSKSPDILDFYEFRLQAEKEGGSLETSVAKSASQHFETQSSFWHEKIELIFGGEQILCHQFINVKAINKASQGYSVSMLAAAALPGGRL